MTLTKRQKQVLALMAEGHEVKNIAFNLGIAYGTTKIHLRGAYQSLGAKTGAQAVAIGLRNGLIQ